MSRLVGKTRSRERLLVCVLGMIGFGLGLRMVDVAVYGKLPLLAGSIGLAARLFVLVTYGSQGKYLEVFALGAFCTTIYQIINEESRALRRAMRWVGLALFIAAFPLMFALARIATTHEIETPILAGIYHIDDFTQIGGPLAVGFGYAMLVMGALWSGGWIRALFEAWPLRFVGLISYSLYLWHQPIIYAALPFTSSLTPPARVEVAFGAAVFVALPVAYLSYQFVERPFLRRRRRIAERAETTFNPVTNIGLH